MTAVGYGNGNDKEFKPAFTAELENRDVDGLIICGVELVCCVLYAVLGASERGYHYLVPTDLISGQDFGEETDNRAVREYLRYNQPEHLNQLQEPPGRLVADELADNGCVTKEPSIRRWPGPPPSVAKRYGTQRAETDGGSRCASPAETADDREPSF